MVGPRTETAPTQLVQHYGDAMAKNEKKHGGYRGMSPSSKSRHRRDC